MGKKFNPKENISFLQYLDANNLCGWTMIQELPTGGFKWVDGIAPNDISRLANCVNKGD